MTIYDEVKSERRAQDIEWGGPAHDDEHTDLEWIGLLNKHLARAFTPNKEVYRKQMVRIAALAAAAVESMDRQRRDI